MALQNYTPMRLAPTVDTTLRHELLKVDIFLRQLTPFAGRVPTFPQGSTAASIDLNQFLFLPGRAPLQRAFGQVVFSGKSADEASVLDDSVFRGLTILGQDDTGLQRTTHTVYFQPDSLASANIVRKWIFPSITGSATDTFTFATTSGNQTITNKIITTSQIYVGTAAARNIFVNSNNLNQQFFVGLATTFPTISTLTPQLRLPQLDVSVPTTDRHTFMMLKASIAAPFTIGSIAHGNHDGSEMQMLPASSTNGRALRFNTGETVAATTWTAGGTTILGTFDITKTRPGMRVRGNSGTNVYVDEDTMIVTVSATQITVDTPLVGNNAATVTVQTWGPTWDSELSGVDHGSLTGLNDDDHLQYLLLAGRTGGQVIGSGAHTGGNTTDVTHEGRLQLGDGLAGVNYTSGRALNISHTGVSGVYVMQISQVSGTPSGVASGTFGMLTLNPAAVAFSSGSYTYRGFRLLAVGALSPSQTVCNEATGGYMQCTPNEAGIAGAGVVMGEIKKYYGMFSRADGTTTPAFAQVTATTTNGSTALTSAAQFVFPIAAGQVITGTGIPNGTFLTTLTDASNIVMSKQATASGTVTITFTSKATAIVGLNVSVTQRIKPATLGAMINFEGSGGDAAALENAAMINLDVTPPFQASTNANAVLVWSFLRWTAAVSGPTTIWGINFTVNHPSQHLGSFALGQTATPTAYLHLGAGTATANTAPLKIAAGTNLTVAEAGAGEYDGSYFYLTHSDTVRTTVVTQRGAVNTTPQAAAIGATTLYTPPAAGYYVVHYTLEDTAADVTAGTIQFQVNYTDDIGATNQTGAALAMTAVGRDRGSFQVWSNSGVISYQTNLVGITGTARYILRVRLESLG